MPYPEYHTHSEYASDSHDHNYDYADKYHNHHDYAPVYHTHDQSELWDTLYMLQEEVTKLKTALKQLEEKSNGS